MNESSKVGHVVSGVKLASVAVKGTDAVFPVRRIYLVGRNYAEHAKEMGHDPEREKPFFFQKPPDAVLPSGRDFPFPSKSSKVHHEVELVVAMASGGSAIDAGSALEHVYGYAVGIDITRRDLQQSMKDQGRPWEAGKSFDFSAPISDIAPAKSIGHPESGEIWLKVNDEMRQHGNINQLIWSVPEVISELSKLFSIAAGDLIFTGTPAGVGPLAPGDRVSAGVEGVGEVQIKVA